ncbi:hypothetical protein BT96DRAFT_90296 [Gymnopus androsaceus JB14]|uniref:Uncharacterized protein n=1 Tax=Gymnopus androsaceus JB14 TaxID=1447944 RepID=A0A6A4HH68_9AGAR|nr:hypothetical protein BT96DRAFT_90296 [Gymnopus androsaceus JB14]
MYGPLFHSKLWWYCLSITLVADLEAILSCYLYTLTFFSSYLSLLLLSEGLIT